MHKDEDINTYFEEKEIDEFFDDDSLFDCDITDEAANISDNGISLADYEQVGDNKESTVPKDFDFDGFLNENEEINKLNSRLEKNSASTTEDDSEAEIKKELKNTKINNFLLLAVFILLAFFLSQRYFLKAEDESIELYSSLVATEVSTEITENGTAASFVININTADITELTQLDGIGKSRAQAIIDYRERYGDFRSIEELKDVDGIGDKIFEGIKNSVTIK